MSKGPISLGALLLIGGIADHAYAAPKAALCSSGVGEFGQALDPSIASDCSTYRTMEHAVGWLIGGGIALLVIGIIWFAVAAGIIGAEMNRDRKNKGRQAAPNRAPNRTANRAAPGASRVTSTPGTTASTGTSAPFATPAPFDAPTAFDAPPPSGTPAPSGTYGDRGNLGDGS